jgi:Zinc knuckle
MADAAEGLQPDLVDQEEYEGEVQGPGQGPIGPGAGPGAGPGVGLPAGGQSVAAGSQPGLNDPTRLYDWEGTLLPVGTHPEDVDECWVNPKINLPTANYPDKFSGGDIRHFLEDFASWGMGLGLAKRHWPSKMYEALATGRARDYMRGQLQGKAAAMLKWHEFKAKILVGPWVASEGPIQVRSRLACLKVRNDWTRHLGDLAGLFALAPTMDRDTRIWFLLMSVPVQLREQLFHDHNRKDWESYKACEERATQIVNQAAAGTMINWGKDARNATDQLTAVLKDKRVTVPKGPAAGAGRGAALAAPGRGGGRVGGRGGGRGAVVPKNDGCRICNDPGHWQNECPQNPVVIAAAAAAAAAAYKPPPPRGGGL